MTLSPSPAPGHPEPETASAACGMDGAAMLLLSNLVILASGGLFWLWLLRRTYLTAKRAPTGAASPGWLLVLGMRLRDGRITPDFARRLDRASELLRRHAGCKAVLLGGVTGSDPRSEALAGREYLVARGIAPGRVVIEDRSRHTLENLLEARKLLAGAEGEAPLLISNRFHLARSGAIAAGLGMRHRLCAAETELSLSPLTLLRLLKESYFLHWYYVGRSWARWTANRKMLGRVS